MERTPDGLRVYHRYANAHSNAYNNVTVLIANANAHEFCFFLTKYKIFANPSTWENVIYLTPVENKVVTITHNNEK